MVSTTDQTGEVPGREWRDWAERIQGDASALIGLAMTNPALVAPAGRLLQTLREMPARRPPHHERERWMIEQSLKRPPDFYALSMQEQWFIDKRLGILDWDGSGITDADRERYRAHFEPQP